MFSRMLPPLHGHDKPDDAFMSVPSASPVERPRPKGPRCRSLAGPELGFPVLFSLQGEVPNPIEPPTGCHFHPRCPIKKLPLCATERPELRAGANGHSVACHLRG
jgi:oligopeptide/dipeptide ABC transporter ATP-binding protein